jgi:hypothetical protein
MSTPDLTAVKAEPRIRPHEVPFYDALSAVMQRHKALIAQGQWDERAWLDDLSGVLTEHFSSVARSEVQRHLTEDWQTLQRYGLERGVWEELFGNAMEQWVDGYVPVLLDQLRENNARLITMELSAEDLSERLSGQVRAERIAITEYTTVVGATQTMITMLFNEVMNEVENGTDQ